MGEFMPAGEYTEEKAQSWRKLLDVQEQEDQLNRATTFALPADITVPHFFVFGCARHSSHPGAPTMQQTLQGMTQTINSYDGILNNPQNQHIVEGQRPGGVGTALGTHLVVIARHGGMPVPTHTGNLDSPILQHFVATFDHITSPNNANQPLEIHFLLCGIAGFSVGPEGWGDRTQGFFRKVLDRDAANHTGFANHIYLVFLMELHVVDPNAPSSINAGQPAHGMRYQNKQIVKVNLAEIVDRYAQLRAHATMVNQDFRTYMQNVALLHQGLQPVGFAGAPIPVFPGPPATAAKLDRMIMAMSWEKAWRVAWLDAQTMPTDAMVQANNVNRNNSM